LPPAQNESSGIAALILPFVFVLYVIAFIDRMNIVAAALQPRDLGFSDKVIGFRAGIFFFELLSAGD
jgi:MFS transporter, ACS family, tartrate transporter